MKPINTVRIIEPGGDIDGEWQIVAEGNRGEWQWHAGWNSMALTWFWDRVRAGSIFACQGRTPGKSSDCFTLYAKLSSKAMNSAVKTNAIRRAA
jgi:hypothetical protein